MHKSEIHVVPKSVISLETRKEQGITEILGSQLQLTSGTTMGYSQVPAPLPILGAAAFFGSVRRIGQASKRLRAIPKG